MTPEFLKEITDYLVSKKIPIELFQDLLDHICCQIEEIMQNENTNFDAAFQKVKEIWKEDLKLYYDGSFNLEDSSNFIKKIKKHFTKA